jgi:hypothetical protein
VRIEALVEVDLGEAAAARDANGSGREGEEWGVSRPGVSSVRVGGRLAGYVYRQTVAFGVHRTPPSSWTMGPT